MLNEKQRNFEEGDNEKRETFALFQVHVATLPDDDSDRLQL